jgi:hypothetical protein
MVVMLSAVEASTVQLSSENGREPQQADERQDGSKRRIALAASLGNNSSWAIRQTKAELKHICSNKNEVLVMRSAPRS